MALDKNLIIESSANALSDAWREQWAMIEDEESVLSAEYLGTVAVAKALSTHASGCIRIERLIRRAFCNAIMRGKIGTPIPDSLRQGRIDVVVAEDDTHFIPRCLIEIKRDMNLPKILSDANRIAVLLDCTLPNLPDIFGICLFPLILFPLPGDPLDYDTPHSVEMIKIQKMVATLQATHTALNVSVKNFPGANIERPSVVREEYDDGITEAVWDSSGFRMEPVMIILEKRAPSA